MHVLFRDMVPIPQVTEHVPISFHDPQVPKGLWIRMRYQILNIMFLYHSTAPQIHEKCV